MLSSDRLIGVRKPTQYLTGTKESLCSSEEDWSSIRKSQKRSAVRDFHPEKQTPRLYAAQFFYKIYVLTRPLSCSDKDIETKRLGRPKLDVGLGAESACRPMPIPLLSGPSTMFICAAPEVLIN
ncbi:hypothetical protein FRB91_009421 [Serendipita sp. 411]|nr:hypothetical protein FRC18_009433 [Serendipita sp. 400]KAG8850019.1 hypothetical protein FRB91_009421 [Serendipita sp. 411]